MSGLLNTNWDVADCSSNESIINDIDCIDSSASTPYLNDYLQFVIVSLPEFATVGNWVDTWSWCVAVKGFWNHSLWDNYNCWWCCRTNMRLLILIITQKPFFSFRSMWFALIQSYNWFDIIIQNFMLMRSRLIV